MKKYDFKSEVLDCVCHSSDHCYIIKYEDDWDSDNDKWVYIEPHLNTGNFWYRLKYAIKYLFGWKTRYGGAFDEIVISKDNYQPLKKLVEYFEPKKYQFYCVEDMKSHQTEYRHWNDCIHDVENCLGKIWKDPNTSETFRIIGFEDNEDMSDFYWILQPIRNDSKIRYELWNNSQFIKNIVDDDV